MDIKSCRECPIGREKRNEFLSNNESVFDAVSDFILFIEKCSKKCSYLKKETNKDCINKNK